MRAPHFVYRASTARLVVADHLQRAWWRYRGFCERLETFAKTVLAAYGDLWRRGWRWWAPALALAPIALVLLPVLSVVATVARALGAAVAALLALVLAAAVAAPVLAIAWALLSFAGQESGTEPARAAEICDPSYPEFCVAEDSADLDCPLGGASPPHAPASNLVVAGADVHELDGDEDGIGCETSKPASP